MALGNVRILICAFHTKLAWSKHIREKVPDTSAASSVRGGLEKLIRLSTPSSTTKSLSELDEIAASALREFYDAISDQVAFLDYFKGTWAPKVRESRFCLHLRASWHCQTYLVIQHCAGMWCQLFWNVDHCNQETTGSIEKYHGFLKVCPILGYSAAHLERSVCNDTANTEELTPTGEIPVGHGPPTGAEARLAGTCHTNCCGGSLSTHAAEVGLSSSQSQSAVCVHISKSATAISRMHAAEALLPQEENGLRVQPCAREEHRAIGAPRRSYRRQPRSALRGWRASSCSRQQHRSHHAAGILCSE